MKRSELSIGDWVSATAEDGNTYIGKVDSIGILRDLDMEATFVRVYVEDKRLHIDMLVENIEPVLLTEEILKANGFENYCGNEWIYKGDEQDVQISVWLYSKRTDIDTSRDSIRFHPHYVHEQQRALRVCGLWELANSFKVETTI